jgi:hypothetical protein
MRALLISGRWSAAAATIFEVGLVESDIEE